MATRDAIIQQRRRLRIERAFAPRFAREYERAARQAESDYITGGQSRVTAGMEVHQQNLQDILFQLYEVSTASAISYVRDKFGKRFRGKIETKQIDDSFTDSILNIFTRTALTRATLISTTTNQEAIKAIALATLPQEDELGRRVFASTREIAGKLYDSISGIKRWKAEQISRTEVGMAVSKAQYEATGALDLPPYLNEWDASLDSRTRPDHRAVNGDRRKPGEYFNVGGQRMLHPQDPSGGSAQTISCRCVLIERFIEDL